MREYWSARYFDCPICQWEVIEDHPKHKADWKDPDTATCGDCGARWEIDNDADYDGEGYYDCSTLGERIDKGE